MTTQYRLLNPGEPIQPNTEVHALGRGNVFEWITLEPSRIGEQQQPGFIYRAPLSSELAWIPIAERKPTEEDEVGILKCRGVLWMDSDGYIELGRWFDVGHSVKSHWCRIPAFMPENCATASTPTTSEPPSEETGHTPREFWVRLCGNSIPISHALFHDEEQGRDFKASCDDLFLVREVLPQPSGSREGREDSGLEAPTPQGKPPKQTDLAPGEKELMKFINATPVVLSCLYDIDLMPEQVERKSREWCHMLIIASHFRDALEAVKVAESERETKSSDDVREPKALEKIALISALRKVMLREGSLIWRQAFEALADELEKEQE